MNSHAIDIYEEKESWGFYIDFENESEYKSEDESEDTNQYTNHYTNQNEDANQNEDDKYKTKKTKCCTAIMLIKVSSTTLVSIISFAYFILYVL
jgi:hypothetical protein